MKVYKILLFMAIFMMLPNCIVQQSDREKEEIKSRHDSTFQRTRPVKEDLVVRYARSYKGTPYRFGGCSRNGLDCSCLVQRAFRSVGAQLPRNSRAQATYANGKVVSINELKRGDLVFFRRSRGDIGHVGIVTESGSNGILFIHSSKYNGGVREDSLRNNMWRRIFVKGLRVL